MAALSEPKEDCISEEVSVILALILQFMGSGICAPKQMHVYIATTGLF